MFDGKNIFCWNIPDVFGGDPDAFTKLLVEGGFEGVFLKASEGPGVFKMYTNGPFAKWGENVHQDLVQRLRAAKIKVYLWHFNYGAAIAGELSTAIHQCSEFKPDGYIWDVETAFDENMRAEENARHLSQGLAMAHPEIPQALCWWALPLNPDNYAREWHPVKVAKAFLQTVDCVIPMMYWGGSKKEQALAYLDQSLKIWRTITDKPILPTGRAYNGDRGVMNADAIIAFAEKVLSMSKTSNLPGISWWYLDGVIKNNLCWDALKKTSKFLSKVTLPQDVLINRLVAAHPDLFPELK